MVMMCRGPSMLLVTDTCEPVRDRERVKGGRGKISLVSFGVLQEVGVSDDITSADSQYPLQAVCERFERFARVFARFLKKVHI